MANHDRGGLKALARLTDTFAPVPATSSLLDLLASTQRLRLERALRGFSQAERDVLLDLRRLGRRRRLLLVADNAHWWDSGSIDSCATALKIVYKPESPSCGN